MNNDELRGSKQENIKEQSLINEIWSCKLIKSKNFAMTLLCVSKEINAIEEKIPITMMNSSHSGVSNRSRRIHTYPNSICMHISKSLYVGFHESTCRERIQVPSPNAKAEKATISKLPSCISKAGAKYPMAVSNTVICQFFRLPDKITQMQNRKNSAYKNQYCAAGVFQIQRMSVKAKLVLDCATKLLIEI